MTAGWETLEDLERRAARLGVDGFSTRHAGPWLVRLQDPPAGQQQVQWVPVMNAPQGGRMLLPRAHAACVAHELVKVTGKGARSRIFVGRGEENDVVVRERSVSATHALLEVNEEGPWRVLDGGSRNGVKHNGARVSATTGSNLSSGDVLYLGDVALGYFSTRALLEALPTWCTS